MSKQILETGETCRIVLVGLDSIREVMGRIIRTDQDGTVILIESPVLNAKPGTVVMLDGSETRSEAFSKVIACTTVRRRFAVKLGKLKWKEEFVDRCQRHAVKYRCVFTISECDSKNSAERKTVGEIINISPTGALIRSRSMLSVGDHLHVQFFVKTQTPVCALGRVIRLESEEDRTESGVIGVRFLAFLSGLDELQEVFGDEISIAPVPTDSEIDETDLAA